MNTVLVRSVNTDKRIQAIKGIRKLGGYDLKLAKSLADSITSTSEYFTGVPVTVPTSFGLNEIWKELEGFAEYAINPPPPTSVVSATSDTMMDLIKELLNADPEFTGVQIYNILHAVRKVYA